MKKTFLLFVFFLVYNLLNAQRNPNVQQKKDVPVLSMQKQMLVKSFKKFYQQHHINVTPNVINQLAKVLSTTCEMICEELPLPVSGLELKGERLDQERVELKWHTLSESNNDGFIIERQFEFSNHFDSVRFVKGVGDAYGKTKYGSIDVNKNEENTLYRLRQVDLDGKFTYSNTIVVKGYNLMVSVSVLPNPVTSSNLTIKLNGFKSKAIHLSIYNASGSMVYKMSPSQLGVGNYFFIQDVNWPPGVYHVRARSNDQHSSTTFIIR